MKMRKENCEKQKRVGFRKAECCYNCEEMQLTNNSNVLYCLDFRDYVRHWEVCNTFKRRKQNE